MTSTKTKTIYFGFAIADSMFSGDANITRRELSPEEALKVIEKGIEPCLNPSHKATIVAMEERFGINVVIPEVAPKVELEKGDSLLLMSVRGLPRLGADRHEYTHAEVASASFQFALWTLESRESTC